MYVACTVNLNILQTRLSDIVDCFQHSAVKCNIMLSNLEIIHGHQLHLRFNGNVTGLKKMRVQL
jgi:hypothetical protein